MNYKKLYKDKNGWLVRDYLAAMIIFSLVISLVFLVISGLGEDYGNEDIIDESFNEHYNQLDNSTGNIEEMFKAASDGEGMSIIGGLGAMFKSARDIISLTFGGIGLLGKMSGNFAEDFGVPTVITDILFPAIIAIITVTIIFIIISYINRGKI